jgi:hypothetical protein
VDTTVVFAADLPAASISDRSRRGSWPGGAPPSMASPRPAPKIRRQIPEHPGHGLVDRSGRCTSAVERRQLRPSNAGSRFCAAALPARYRLPGRDDGSGVIQVMIVSASDTCMRQLTPHLVSIEVILLLDQIQEGSF